MAEPHENYSRDQVVDAIERWFAPQWFSRFAADPGWSAQKLLWMGLLMNWVAGHTRTERFVAARDLLRTLKGTVDLIYAHLNPIASSGKVRLATVREGEHGEA